MAHCVGSGQHMYKCVQQVGARRQYTLVSQVQFCVSDRNSKHAPSTRGCSPHYTTLCPLVLSAAIRRFSSTSRPTYFPSVSGSNSEFRTVGGPMNGEKYGEKHITSVFASSSLHVLLLLLLLLDTLTRNHDIKINGSTPTSDKARIGY